MSLAAFNALDPAEAATRLRACVRIDSWVDTLLAGRPYDDVPGLLATARAQAATWTRAEVEAALADHPRIGERPTDRSRREQAGVPDGLEGADVRARLAEGNRRYEERFGRIYLVRAAGRSAAEMLALLEERLTNDPATELAVTTEQLGEIALRRLEEQVG